MITTHVLDIARGTPAAGVKVFLDLQRGEEWVRVSNGRTDERGRLMTLTEVVAVTPGVYRLTFEIGAYYQEHGVTPFFPEVQVAFQVREGAGDHFHVPLVISPYGYSTYRGA